MDFSVFFGITFWIIVIIYIINKYFLKSQTTNKSSPATSSNQPKPTFKTASTLSSSPKLFNNIDLGKWVNETIAFHDGSKSAKQLVESKDINKIVYGDLLSCFEWRHKRLKILLRDGYKCSQCFKRSKSNHVHHNYYIQDKFPWDINDSILETLCFNCHVARHQKEKIPVYSDVQGKLILKSFENPSCSRCGGTGYLAEYTHVQNGICFKCWGNNVNQGVFSQVLYTLQRNLNYYREHELRNEYIELIRGITMEQFILLVPDALSYKRNENNEIVNDDLPF
jgi:hypothetical protein